MKRARQAEILNVIRMMDVETQEQLLAELKLRGFTTTQATISRDIKQLRLVKELAPSGSYRYVAADRQEAKSSAGRLRNIFKEGVVSVEAAQNHGGGQDHARAGLGGLLRPGRDGDRRDGGQSGGGRHRDAHHAGQRRRQRHFAARPTSCWSEFETGQEGQSMLSLLHIENIAVIESGRYPVRSWLQRSDR